ncbi:MAG: hypothetical protein ABEI52_00890 [Halobacteriaceae archaeon]
MPPEGFTTITVPDEVFEQVMAVMSEFSCDSSAEAVSVAATLALERDEVQIARILADLLAEES